MLIKAINMSTFKWLILLGVNILQCTSELISGEKFHINKRMNGHVIHILSNMGAKMCLRHCHRYKDCNAVNYLPQILKCQLLALTDQDDHLILDSEYMYANMTNLKMDSDSCWPTNPCQEDTRCLPTHLNGHACLTFVTPCTASPCKHGYCNITNDGYKCTCDAGCSGGNCEITPCTAIPYIHGYFNITNDGYKCTCDAGYSGVNCEILENPCMPDPCRFGRNCIVCEGNSYRCSANLGVIC